MVAAPYKVTLVVALGSPNGPRKQFPLTASDVNGEFWLFPSGSSDVVLNGKYDQYVVDTILSAAGTDTTQSIFYIGGVNTNVTLLNATSLYNAVIRPFQQAPLKIPAGVSIKVKQAT